MSSFTKAPACSALVRALKGLLPGVAFAIAVVGLARAQSPAPADGGLAGFTRDIRAAGAVPDGKTLNTTVFNRVIDELAATGGGTVYVPPGTYLTGTIYLKSHVTLHLENGATILGSTEISDYPENSAPRPNESLEFGRYALISAEGQEDVALVGQGRIRGQGSHPNFTKKDLLARGWSARDAYLKRPFGLSFVGCRRVRVQDVRLEDIAFWCQCYLDCDDVVVHGVTVDSKKLDYNNDGIDIDGSRHVRVSDCHFKVGDDAICLKASYRDCENIVVTNCTASSLANGVKLGTASNGGFKNVTISNISLDGINASGIALEIVDGGTLDGVNLSDFVMRDVGSAIFIRLGNRAKSWTDGAPPGIGILRNVSIANIVAQVNSTESTPLASSITGLPGHPVENVSLSNIRLVTQRSHTRAESDIALSSVEEHASDYPEYSMFGALPAYGFFVRHVRGLTMRDVDVGFAETDFRSSLVIADADALELAGIGARTLPDSHPVILLSDVTSATVRGCTAGEGTGNFLRVEGRSSKIHLVGNSLAGAAVPVATADNLPLGTVVIAP